ncbi:hypothetical protein [Nostoc phage YongM]|nr:hypothetical protein [Nostoc phage YongM]
MYYNQLILKSKLKTILSLIKLINIDSLSTEDLKILNKFIIKSLFLLRFASLKKSIMSKILESLYNFVEDLIDKSNLYIDCKDLIKKLDGLIFLLKLITVKYYRYDSGVVNISKDNITINDRFKHY